jgi:hypothetical protein
MSGHSVYGDDNTDDCFGHGTHVSGIVGGLQYGVAKNVTIVPGGRLRAFVNSTWLQHAAQKCLLLVPIPRTCDFLVSVCMVSTICGSLFPLSSPTGNTITCRSPPRNPDRILDSGSVQCGASSATVAVRRSLCLHEITGRPSLPLLAVHVRQPPRIP